MSVPTRTYLTMTNLGSVQNSTSFARPKTTLAGVGTKPCTNRPGTQLNREIRVAKKNYSEKLKKNSFQVMVCG